MLQKQWWTPTTPLTSIPTLFWQVSSQWSTAPSPLANEPVRARALPLPPPQPTLFGWMLSPFPRGPSIHGSPPARMVQDDAASFQQVLCIARQRLGFLPAAMPVLVSQGDKVCIFVHQGTFCRQIFLVGKVIKGEGRLGLSCCRASRYARLPLAQAKWHAPPTCLFRIWGLGPSSLGSPHLWPGSPEWTRPPLQHLPSPPLGLICCATTSQFEFRPSCPLPARQPLEDSFPPPLSPLCFSSLHHTIPQGPWPHWPWWCKNYWAFWSCWAPMRPCTWRRWCKVKIFFGWGFLVLLGSFSFNILFLFLFLLQLNSLLPPGPSPQPNGCGTFFLWREPFALPELFVWAPGLVVPENKKRLVHS